VPWAEGNVECLCTSTTTVHCNRFHYFRLLIYW